MMAVVSSYPADPASEAKMLKNQPKTRKAQPPHGCRRRRRGVLLSLLSSLLFPPSPAQPLLNSSPAEPEMKKEDHVEASSTQGATSPAAPEPGPEPELQGRTSSESDPGAAAATREGINGEYRWEVSAGMGRGTGEGEAGETKFNDANCAVSSAAAVHQPQADAATERQHRATVKRLLFGAGTEEERAAVAAEVGRMASAGGPSSRKSLASLGVIPCLVDLLGCPGTAAAAAARALVHLADGTYSNKVAMVEAGVIRKLSRALQARQEYCHQTDELMALLRAITSLAKTSQALAHHLPPSACAPLLPPLLRAIATTSATASTKHDALSALLNLSSHLPNTRPMVSGGFVPLLLRVCFEEVSNEDRDGREKQQLTTALAVLGNLAVTREGAAAVEREEDLAPACIVTALRSSFAAPHDDGELQHRALRVLATLARGSRLLRGRMLDVGLVKLLVEVSLLSESNAARRTAAEMINWFKGPDCCVWAPRGPGLERYSPSTCSSSYGTCCRSGDSDSAAHDVEDSAGKQTTFTSTTGNHRDEVRRMVRQSLDRNMESIVRRANGTIATTSRSSSCLAHCSRHHLSHPSLKGLNHDINDSFSCTSTKSLSF